MRTWIAIGWITACAGAVAAAEPPPGRTDGPEGSEVGKGGYPHYGTPGHLYIEPFFGAAVDIEDRGRRSTPLRRAVANTGKPGTSGKQDVAVEITAILLDHGADPKHVNRSGKPMLASTRHAKIRSLLEAAICAG